MEHQSNREKSLNIVANFFNALLLYTIYIKAKNKKKGDNFCFNVQERVEQTGFLLCNFLKHNRNYSNNFQLFSTMDPSDDNKIANRQLLYKEITLLTGQCWQCHWGNFCSFSEIAKL